MLFPLLALALLAPAASSSITWRDVTAAHHNPSGSIDWLSYFGRGRIPRSLHGLVHREQQADPDANVRRGPSPTSHVFELGGDHHEAGRRLAQQEQEVMAPSATTPATSTITMELPLCHGGGLLTFRVGNSGFVPNKLQQAFPDVHVLHGAADDGITTAEIVTSTAGIHAQIWVQDKPRCFIDPHTRGNSVLHTVYAADDVEPKGAEREHPNKAADLVLSSSSSASASASASSPPVADLHALDYFHSVGQQQGGSRRRRLNRGHAARRAQERAARRLQDRSSFIRPPPAGAAETFTYTIAVACTAGYVDFANDGRGGPLALLSATLARAGGIWARTVGINFRLTPSQANLFKYRAGDLPESNTALLDGEINHNGALIASGMYYITVGGGVSASEFDLGHFFGTSPEGGVGGGFPCAEGKVGGATQLESPTGDSFDVNYVAHELGHQWNTAHTWAGSKGGCTADQFDAKAAVELGSGSTLETYAGDCFTDNTKDAIDPYFHVYSLSRFQIWLQNTGDGISVDDSIPLGAGGKAPNCGVFQASATNKRPTVTVPRQCAIPRKTPYILTGSASDDDASDTLTFSWEQIDAASKQTSLDVESADGPLVISAMPSTTGHTRYIPPLSNAALGTSRTVDKLNRLSSRKRTLHFTLTARDHFSAAGGGALDTTWGTWHAATLPVDVSKLGPLQFDGKGQQTIPTGASVVSWSLPGTLESGDAAGRALRAAEFTVKYLACDTGEVCFTTTPLDQWTQLATGAKLTAKADNSGARGSASIYLPSSVATKRLRIAISGQVENGAGCTFWTVSPIMTATSGTTQATLVSTSPVTSAADVPTPTKIVSLAFSAPVFILPSSTATMTVRPAAAGSTTIATFRGSHLAVTGNEVAGDLSTVSSGFTGLPVSTEIIVAVEAGLLCSAPVVAGGACPAGGAIGATSFTFTTASSAGPATAAPILADPASRFPIGATADGTMDVDASNGQGATIEILFDQPVFLVEGGGPGVDRNITIDDTGSPGYYPYPGWCHIPLSDSNQVAIEGSVLRINLHALCGLWPSTGYTATIASGALQNSAGDATTAAVAVSWTTAPDITAPTVTEKTPAASATGVPEYTEISLVFSEPIQLAAQQAGVTEPKVTFKCKGPAVACAVAEPSCDESLSLRDTTWVEFYEDGEVIMLPEYDLCSNAEYAVIVPAGVGLQDHSGNAFAGIADGEYTFTTGDTWPPRYSSTTFAPTGGAGSADNIVTATIVFQNDDVQGLKRSGKGVFVLTDVATNVAQATTSITSTGVTINGNSVVVRFATPLPGPATYVLAFDGGVVQDQAGNPCSGLGPYIANGKHMPAPTGQVQPRHTTTVTLACTGLQCADALPVGPDSISRAAQAPGIEALRLTMAVLAAALVVYW